ncbi:MAG: MMPL family transporter, partial [Flavobacteriales bacterium]|nr:MMPL family transporter [Flavobacteriales bacterium]
MWSWIASRVLRNRAGILVVLGLITVFMGYMARDVEMSFKFGGLLPKTDSAYIDYQNFLSEFSEDGNVIVLGVQGEKFYTPEVFSAWHHLGNDLKRIEGVDSVFSEANLFTLVRDDSLKRFVLAPVGPVPPNSQAELDTLLKHVRDLPFYNGLLYNDSTRASLMMVFVDAPLFNTKERGKVMKALEERVAAFEAVGVPVHYSGLPFIRVKTVDLVRGELPMFVGLAVGVTALLLLLFFWSWRVMWMSLVVVSVSVIWSFGTIGILGYKLTMLTSVIPPLLIVIGVPNCVFLINKYHHEYVRHGNQIKALQRVIARVGTAAFMTNATTAMGFATFMVTYSDVLREFGLIASLNIMSLYVLAILLIPIFFSYQKPPKPRHTSHLDRPWLDRITEFIVSTVMNRRPAVFLAMGGFLVIGLVGFSRLRNESRIVDDLPANSRVLTDLRFFERNFNGVMPLEVLVDTKKKGGALRDATLKRIVKLEDTLATYDEFSKPLSIADAVKFTRQAFYGGNPDRYGLITSREKSFILPYLDGAGDKEGMAKAFLDSTRQRTRITVQMADVGTERMEVLLDRLAPQLDSLFSPDKYRVTMTGTSVVFLKGSAYMVS